MTGQFTHHCDMSEVSHCCNKEADRHARQVKSLTHEMRTEKGEARQGLWLKDLWLRNAHYRSTFVFACIEGEKGSRTEGESG